jgi:hypothetical protein
MSGGWELEGRQTYTKSDSEDGDSEQIPAHRGEQLSEWLTLTTDSEFRALQLFILFQDCRSQTSRGKLLRAFNREEAAL